MSSNLPDGVTQAMVDAAWGEAYDPIRQALVDHLGDCDDAHKTADAIEAVIHQRIRPHLAALFALAASPRYRRPD